MHTKFLHLFQVRSNRNLFQDTSHLSSLELQTESQWVFFSIIQGRDCSCNWGFNGVHGICHLELIHFYTSISQHTFFSRTQKVYSTLNSITYPFVIPAGHWIFENVIQHFRKINRIWSEVEVILHLSYTLW